MRGLFVTGTDTGVGKTVLAGAIAAALVARGERVAAFKPALTGLDEEPDPGWPRDHELLGEVTGRPAADVAPWRFGPAVSPHLAGELAEAPLDPRALVSAARGCAWGSDVLVVEGVGGLLVPLTPRYLVRDLVRELGLPVVIAARPGLGTINHTLLTLEAARGVGLDVAGVVMTPWPQTPSEIELSNRATVAALGATEVSVLPRVAAGDPGLLAVAGAALPIEEWLDGREPVQRTA